jgi:hypothetical protein
MKKTLTLHPERLYTGGRRQQTSVPPTSSVELDVILLTHHGWLLRRSLLQAGR